MKQERETTPPADASSSSSLSSPPLSRVTPPPCDETPQKGASSSSSDPSAPCSNPPSPPRRADTARLSPPKHQEEVALRETAHAAGGAPENEERGKKAGTNGAIVASHRRASLKKQGRTARSILNGGLTGGLSTFDRGKDARHKRLPSVQHVEPPRSVKRQKTQTKNEAPKVSASFTSGHFALTSASPTPDPVPKSLEMVDLTESQQSADLEVVSNRSNFEPTSSAQVPEYRSVERAHSANASHKRQRRSHVRPLRCAQSTTPKEIFSDGEDDLTKDEDGPPRKKHAPDQHKGNPRTAIHLPPGVGTAKGQTEDISDDELGSQDRTSRDRHVSSKDRILNEDARKPRKPTVTRSRGDITRVDFPKSENANRPRLNIVRAVSGKETLDVTGLPLENHPVLKVGDDPNTLIAVDRTDKRCTDYRWLEVKPMYCTKIQYSTTKPPLAAISRSSGGGASPLLVLEFAQPGDALTLGLWADAMLKNCSTRRMSCFAEDSEQLEKIFSKQMQEAGDWDKKHAPKPDDIKYLEHHEKTKLKPDENSTPGSRPRPISAQQTTPTQTGRQLLRHGMQGDGSASAIKPASTTTSFFTLNHAKDRRTDAKQTRALPSRQVKDGASRPTLNSSPSLYGRKSPSPVSWINQNPDWVKIWDDKPLIFPAIGKNRASVYRDDISRLEEGEYLNDNLIGFYLRYLQVNLERANKALADRIYIMNTYFYPKLTDVKAGRGINYDGVKSWTAKIDLFSFDYIVVPVNESAHWYLAIICNPARLLQRTDAQPKAEKTEPAEDREDKTDGELGGRSAAEGLISTVGEQVEHMSLEEVKPEEGQPREEGQKTEEKGPKVSSNKQRPPRKLTGTLARKQDPSEARVITLDSLGVGHSPTCGNLKSYLVREAKDKRNFEVEPPGTFGMTAKGIPEQEDHASCGAFLLGYMREFLKDPDGVVAKLVRKEAPSWDITSPAMRSELRNIIIEKRKEQNALAAEKKAKRKSNAQSPATSKSPEKRQEAEPATPKTPQPVLDAPKNPSSTVKGSPAIDRLPLNHRSNPLAKDDASAGAAHLQVAEPPTEAEPTSDDGPLNGVEPPLQTEAPRSSGTVAATSEENGLLGPLKQSSEGPKSPVRVQSRTDTSTPVRLRTSPRHTKSKPANDDGAFRMLSPLVSSPAKPTSEKRSASKGTKRKLSNSEILLCRLPSSPSKSPRRNEPVTVCSKKSISPSQQLLGEMHSSSESTRQHNSASQNGEKQVKRQESIVIEDEAPLKPSPHRMTNKPIETSRYFSAKDPSRISSSPLSGPKVQKKHSMKDDGEAIPSIEDPSETVDLTK
ncbi:ulp1 protease family protein [Colletotrichum incanum]|nr:ulp1 protease family protein [Colletotrichum incanum]